MKSRIFQPHVTHKAEYLASFDTDEHAGLAVWASCARPKSKLIPLPGFLAHIAPEVRRYMANPNVLFVTLSQMSGTQRPIYQKAAVKWLKAQKGVQDIHVTETTSITERHDIQQKGNVPRFV